MLLLVSWLLSEWLRAEMLVRAAARGWLSWLTVRQVQLACVATVRISGRRLAEPCRLRGLYTAVVGAEGGIRTRTSISSQPPEDCVSTNFTTSASPVAEAGIEPAAKGL